MTRWDPGFTAAEVDLRRPWPLPPGTERVRIRNCLRFISAMFQYLWYSISL